MFLAGICRINKFLVGGREVAHWSTQGIPRRLKVHTFTCAHIKGSPLNGAVFSGLDYDIIVVLITFDGSAIWLILVLLPLKCVGPLDPAMVYKLTCRFVKM